MAEPRDGSVADPREVIAAYLERQRLSDESYTHADRIEQLLDEAGWSFEEKAQLAGVREACEHLKAELPSLPGDVLALRTSYLLDRVIDVLGGPSETQHKTASGSASS
jgi:hypothetical protein